MFYLTISDLQLYAAEPVKKVDGQHVLKNENVDIFLKYTKKEVKRVLIMHTDTRNVQEIIKNTSLEFCQLRPLNLNRLFLPWHSHFLHFLDTFFGIFFNPPYTLKLLKLSV